MLNPHHLELFYFVARYRGISRAVRHMPYGIQQPGLSGQILQLEQQLGTKLFVRTPFALTPEGDALYAFVRPFFDNLDAMERQLRTGFAPQLRLGAAEPVLRDHLPVVLRELHRSHPTLRLQLRSGYQSEFESWLLEREIDLAVTALDSRPAPGLSRLPLACLSLVLLVPKRSPLRTTADLWARPALDEPLICLRDNETISRHFQRGLTRHRRTWTPAIVASSLETITQFVADGYGLGVGLAGTAPHRHVRALPLDDFPVVEIVALWLGRPTPVITAALDAMRGYATTRWPASAR